MFKLLDKNYLKYNDCQINENKGIILKQPTLTFITKIRAIFNFKVKKNNNLIKESTIQVIKILFNLI